VGTSKQFLADVNGDSMADLVTFDFDANTGDWSVAASSGSGFWPPHTVDPRPRLRKQPATGRRLQQRREGGRRGLFRLVGNWYVGLSTSSGFGYPGQWSAGHGMNSSNQVAADIVACHGYGTTTLPVVGPLTAAQKWNRLSRRRPANAASSNDR
jgi:hypothetical protein